jgi:hypothetical protein
MRANVVELQVVRVGFLGGLFVLELAVERGRARVIPSIKPLQLRFVGGARAAMVRYAGRGRDVSFGMHVWLHGAAHTSPRYTEMTR